MNETRTLSLEDIEEIAFRALVSAGASAENARPLARATAATEADGIASHGLAYIPIYCEHVQCGKVDGHANPILSRPRPAVVRVDAVSGFAHPAIELGFSALLPAAAKQGIAALAIYNSYNCGVLGYHTAGIAQKGFVGLGFTNAPASIAPSGGKRPVVGTNPWSIAVPGTDGEMAILIDQSASTVAKSEVMKHARDGKPIPLGWALDIDGNPTTDAELALKGSMAPSGGYKGVGVALLTEIMAAALAGASLGIYASPFSGTAGGPPKTGQFFLAIDPLASTDGEFTASITSLVKAFRSQESAHLPGDGRRKKHMLARKRGVAVNTAILERIQSISDRGES